jgi:hypothetical protein
MERLYSITGAYTQSTGRRNPNFLPLSIARLSDEREPNGIEIDPDFSPTWESRYLDSSTNRPLSLLLYAQSHLYAQSQ